MLLPQIQAASHGIASVLGLDAALAHGTGQSRPNVVKAAIGSLAEVSARTNGGSPLQARAAFERLGSISILARRGHS